MRYGYGMGQNVGGYCHWCGASVSNSLVRTGNHLFCRNGRKCQQAHARAFRKYQSRVTVPAPRGAGLASMPGPNRNAQRVEPAPSSSPAIAKDRGRKGNEKRRRK
jgi:hypothetical protein